MSNFLDNPYFMAGLQVLRGRQDFGDALVNASMMQRQQEMENAQIAAQQQKAVQAAQAMQFRNNLGQLLQGNIDPQNRMALLQNVIEAGGGLDEAKQLADLLNPIGRQQVIPGQGGTFGIVNYDPSGKQVMGIDFYNPETGQLQQGMNLQGMAQGLQGRSPMVGQSYPQMSQQTPEEYIADTMPMSNVTSISEKGEMQLPLAAVDVTEAVKAPVKAPEIENAVGMRINLVGRTPEESNMLRKEATDYYKDEVREPALRANQQVLSAQRFLNALDKVPTGGFIPGVLMQVGRAAQGVGISDETLRNLNLPDSEKTAARETINQFNIVNALQYVQQTKGAISNMEMNAFMNASPGLQNTKENNAELAKLVIAANERIKQQKKFFDQWRSRYGSFVGAGETWEAYLEQHPLVEFGDGQMRVIDQNANYTLAEPYLLTRPEYEAYQESLLQELEARGL